jgi:hypothetical protein
MFGSPCYVVKAGDTKEEAEKWVGIALKAVEKLGCDPRTSAHTGGFGQSY